jgi:hypothetical protein
MRVRGGTSSSSRSNGVGISPEAVAVGVVELRYGAAAVCDTQRSAFNEIPGGVVRRTPAATSTATKPSSLYVGNVVDPSVPEAAANQSGGIGEPRWPMALAVLACGVMRFLLPADLRDDIATWGIIAVLVVLLAALMIGDPGRIDRQKPWLRVLTDILISVITLVNAIAAFRLVVAIVNTDLFTQNARVLLAAGAAVWLTNVIAYALWYWDLDRGGAAARARGTSARPAFIFPEMLNEKFVEPGWSPTFVDYFHLSFSTAAAFSPTDVSAVKKWAKLVMISESAISLVVAVNILK